MDFETIESYLSEHQLFRWLDARYIGLLAGCATLEEFKEGEIIFRAGENALRFFIIIRGKITIEQRGKDGPPRIVQELRDGEVFGWSWLLPPFKWHFDAQTREKTTALVFDARFLRHKCDEDRVFGYEMMKRFSSVLISRLHALRLDDPD